MPIIHTCPECSSPVGTVCTVGTSLFLFHSLLSVLRALSSSPLTLQCSLFTLFLLLVWVPAFAASCAAPACPAPPASSPVYMLYVYVCVCYVYVMYMDMLYVICYMLYVYMLYVYMLCICDVYVIYTCTESPTTVSSPCSGSFPSTIYMYRYRYMLCVLLIIGIYLLLLPTLLRVSSQYLNSPCSLCSRITCSLTRSTCAFTYVICNIGEGMRV
jgi:hypothetical protein